MISEKLSILNTSADARNLAAISSFPNDVRGFQIEFPRFEDDLLDAAVLNPKNPDVLANLKSLYQLILESGHLILRFWQTILGIPPMESRLASPLYRVYLGLHGTRSFEHIRSGCQGWDYSLGHPR